MRNTISFITLTLVMLLALAGCAAAANVYFFQSKTSGSYTTDSGYSMFKDKLVENGYEVNDLEQGLSIESLSKVTPEPDILIIPNLGTDLTADETTALFYFVMEEGKGVFLCGATPSTNKLTIPLGMTASEDLLEDDENRIRDISTDQLVTDKTIFYVDLPSERPDVVINSLTRGVNKLDIFTAGGIYLFGNSKGVIFGGDATNTPKALTFPKKSDPPLAAYIQLGKGWIFLLSDPDMIANANLDTTKYTHDNLKFAINIVDWLSQPPTENLSEDEINSIIRAQKAQITDLNHTINTQEQEKADLNNQITALNAEIDTLSLQIINLKKDSFMGLKYEIWGMLVLSLCFILTIGVVVKKNKKELKTNKADLGYEFDEKDLDIGPNAEKTPGSKIKEEDIEARLKELQKGSQ